MQVRDVMTEDVLTIGPDHTIQEAAGLMTKRGVGAAIVLDVDAQTPGIITERDVMRSVAAGDDTARELGRDHLTVEATVVHEHSTLELAAETMLGGGFRHLVVVDERSEILGIVSMRDIVRSWARR